MKVPGGANTQKAAVQAWKIGPNQLWGEVALLSLLLMDFSPLALWFSILSRAQSPQPFGESFLIFFFCTYVGVWFARGLTLLRFPKSFQLPARWLLGIVIVWFCQTAILYPGKWIPIEDYWLIPSSILQQTRIVPTAFWVAIFSLICVFRSFHLASGNITRWDILTSFFTGAFLLTSYGLLLPREQMTESAVAGTIFITFALIAAGCGRITTLAVSKGGSKTRFTPQWLLAIIVSAICVVGVGLALSLGISKISGLFSVLIWLLFLLWVILISGPLMLVGWVIIRLNIQPDNPISVGIMTVLGAFQDFIHLFQTRIRLSLSSSRMSLVGIVLLVVGVSALFILSRLWRRKNRPPEDVDEEDEMIEIENTDQNIPLLQRLQDIARGRWFNLRRWNTRQFWAEAQIRWVYASLLTSAANKGVIRPHSATPAEYLPDLVQLLPAEQSRLGLITHAYERIRYGQYPESDEEVEEVMAAWQSISDAFKLIKKKDGKVKPT